MGRIKKMNFYYGAILTSILQNNPDASPTLILNNEDTRQAYKVLTNTSKECILFFKYASSKQKTNANEDKQYTSLSFSFSEDDKEKLKTYYENTGLPVFICLLCVKDKLNDSEIAILKYEEYEMVSQNQTVTIGLEPGKHNFYLFSGKSKSKNLAHKISTTRINKTFDELTKEVVKASPSHFKEAPTIKKKIYENSLIPEELFEHANSNICPVCNNILENVEIWDEQLNIDAKRCMQCGSVFISRKQYESICKKSGTNHLKENVLLMDLQTHLSDDVKNDSHKLEPLLANQNTIFVIEHEGTVCPIHKIKFQTKVINLGKRKKDTVLYCKQCKKMIIGEEHKKSFINLMNSQKCFKKYNFKPLNIELSH